MDTPRTIVMHAGVAHLAYGMALSDKKDFKSPLAFDDYDLWFGADFDFILDQLLDDLLEDIESDITSVDSTNLSEAASEQMSAQSSADRRAMQRAGLLGSDATSAKTDEEVSRVSTASSEKSFEMSAASASSSDSNKEDIDAMGDESANSDSHRYKNHHHGWDGSSESTYSGRSLTDTSDSGLSNSEGTSQATGEASTVSTVSFTVKQYANVWDNATAEETIELLVAEPETDLVFTPMTDEFTLALSDADRDKIEAKKFQ